MTADHDLAKRITEALTSYADCVIKAKCWNSAEAEATRALIPPELWPRIQWTWIVWPEVESGAAA